MALGCKHLCHEVPMPSSPTPALSPSPSPPSASRQRQLFRAWRDGDPRAGEALFGDLRVRLLAYFHRYPPYMIDDLVQETLVGCLLARHALRCDEALMGYVYCVARRVVFRQLYRGRGPTVAFDEGTAEDHRTFAELDHRLEAQRLLSACPSPHTRMVVLRYVEGHRGVEIARQLHVSEATVRRRLRRGLAELRQSASAPASP
jgi:RNA polymerase sigma factor (sigma-70 family)